MVYVDIDVSLPDTNGSDTNGSDTNGSDQTLGRRVSRNRKLRKRRVSLLDRLLLLFSTSRRVDKLWIATEESSKSGLVLSRVIDALCLIKTHDPHRFNRILRDLDRMWELVVPGADARYYVALRTCECNRRFVLDDASSPELIAATIVHEATHARLWHCGIGYEEEVRARVEKVCIRRELAFAAKLPSGQAVRARAEQKLALPHEFCSDAHAEDRHVGDRVAALRDFGTPAWLMRALSAVRVRRVAPTSGGAHPDTARTPDDVARLQEAQRELERARCGVEPTVAIGQPTPGCDHAEPTLGPEHFDTATILVNLADLVQAQGNLAMARSLFERALAIREKVLGPDHPDTATTLSYLADLLHAQGDLAGMRPLLERALAIDEKALGPDHPSTAIDLSNLGGLLRKQGNFAAARPLLERALKIDQKALGPEHPDTARDLSNLARLLSESGQRKEAEAYFLGAIAIAEKALGPEHPDTGRYQSHYARLLLDAGRAAKALALAETALTTHEASFGVDHPWTKASVRVTADVLAVLGRMEEAAFLRARVGLMANLGPSPGP